MLTYTSSLPSPFPNALLAAFTADVPPMQLAAEEDLTRLLSCPEARSAAIHSGITPSELHECGPLPVCSRRPQFQKCVCLLHAESPPCTSAGTSALCALKPPLADTRLGLCAGFIGRFLRTARHRYRRGRT